MKQRYKLFSLLVILLSYNMGPVLAQTYATFGAPYGSVQTYTVPAGCTSIMVSMAGGKGGDGTGGTDVGGSGGAIVCTLAVTPGQVLDVYVGGMGSGTTGGLGGIPGGPGGVGAANGGGGGGSSEIRVSPYGTANRVIVAGGGGGAGGGTAGGNAGSGGDLIGATGGNGGGITGTSGGGVGGSTTGSSYGTGGASGGNSAGTNGTITVGGTGATGDNGGFGDLGGGGGGGGGGYFTGGGGGGGGYLVNGGGGGGGSNYYGAAGGVSGVTTHSQGTNAGNGYVYICAFPAAGTITGTLTTCTGSTTTLTDVTASGSTGTWSSGTTTVGTVGSTTGVVYGVGGGNTTITFKETTACAAMTTTLTASATAIVTVTATPLAGAITGPTSVCTGSTITLSDGTASGGTGTWSSSNTAVGTVGSTTGVVYGVAAGTTAITYTETGTGCGSTATTVSIITVNASPTAGTITGPGTVCSGLTITLTDATATGSSGTWSSGTTAVGTVGAATGVVYGVSAGTTNITYTESSASCGTATTTATITVNATPIAGTILGPLSLCSGTTITLSDNTASGSSGTWSSSNTAVGTVGSTTGVVYGLAAGTTNITYTESSLACGSVTTDVTVTVIAMPTAILGYDTVCTSLTTSLTDPVAGGTWSSSNTNATVGTGAGLVTGAVAGTAIITYAMSAACYITVTVDVISNPNTIVGLATVCQLGTTSLNDIVTGGTWSSSNTGIATIGSTGTPTTVTGVAAGSVTITYSMGGGCYKTKSMTVTGIPGTITGTTLICSGFTTNLTDAVAGGTWSSSASGTATVATGSASEIVTGGATLGTATISYTTGCGTPATLIVTVTDAPAAIAGVASVCIGSTTTLSDAVTGGTWSSSAPGTGSIGSTSGIVTGIASGTTTISYTTACGSITQVVTVNASPVAGTINGVTSVCSGNSVTLSDATALGGTGTWSSSNTPVGTIDPVTGILYGVSAGVTNIIFTETSAFCGAVTTTMNVTVIASPVAGSITGFSSVCTGLTITLNDLSASGGTGTWSSSNTAVGTVGSTTGVVYGVGAGTTIITFTETSVSCGTVTTTTNISVNVSPAAGTITGPATVCSGLTLTLSDATASGGTGTWSSSNTAVGTVGSTTGIVYGVSAGVTNIIFTETSAFCGAVTTTMNVTVIASPFAGAITGLSSVCAGQTITLNDASASGGTGTWSSSNIAVGTIGSTTGVVYGVSAGTTIITFTETSVSCGTVTTTTNITVNVSPAAGTITGPATVCSGLTITLSDATASGGTGTWSSSNTAVGTIDLVTGILYGVSAGVTNIIFTETSVFCGSATTTMNVTVIASPVAGTITGPTSLCTGTNIALSDATASGGTGTWSSSNTAVGTIGSTTGVVYGVGVGTTTITFTETTVSCGSAITTLNVSVITTPSAGTITGPSSVCTGLTITLSDATAFGGTGTWSSSNTAVGTVDPVTGVVYGVGAGVTTITFTETSVSCGTVTTTTNITVNTSPVAGTITGTPTVCAGLTTTLNDLTASGGTGTWSSSNTAVGTVGSATGVVYGVSAGTTIISFTETTVFCGSATTTVNFTVNVSPFAGAITGPSSVCTGLTITLSDATATGGTGTWSSSNTAVGTVGATTGVVYGVSSGVTTITYTETSVSCGSVTTTTNITVNVSPVAGTITGASSVCAGLTTTLNNLSASGGTGTWSSSNTAVGTIDPVTGVIYGVSAGTTIITFTETSAFCGSATTTTNFTVNVSPFAGAITGPSSVCTGLTITLADATATGGTGTWSSSNTAIGTVGATTGVVYGVSSGVVTITYTETSTFCGSVTTTANVTVNVSPAAGSITGLTSVCVGSTITLNDFTASGGTGTWSSSNTGVGTVGSTTGVVYGVAVGTTTISFTETTTFCGSATTTTNITVNVSPVAGAITGPSSVCTGLTITLSDATAFGGTGTWSSGSTAIGTVGSTTGVVYGVSPGTTTITFTESTASCGTATTTATVTVNISPAAGTITGITAVCAGLTTSLTDVTSSGGTGTWSSSNTAAGTIGSTTGVVYGVAAGTTTITYTETSVSCGSAITTVNVTVNPNPTTITGTLNVCVGLSTTLNSTPAGGTWSSGATGTATINSTSGVVIGVSAGTVTDTYTLSTGCLITTVVTVNPLPSITGTLSVCVGLTTTLSPTIAGGTWSSLSGLVSVGGTTGTVTGLSFGTAAIVYTLPTGCTATAIVTINPLPATISGTLAVCVGSITTLSDAGGGTWSISNSNALISSGTGSGIVSGVSQGLDTVTYTLPTGCIITAVVTVNPLPANITGTFAVCAGLTTSLSDVTPLGTWSSSSSVTASAGSSGIITGGSVLATTTATITYTLPTGCKTTAIVTVNPLPVPISGPLTVCIGLTTPLTDGSPGGTWSASNGHATVGTGSGTTTGVTAGVDSIIYILPTGCLINASVTVNSLPGTITGSLTVCAGLTTSLSDIPAGGTWVSSATGTATINSTSGLVTGGSVLVTSTTTITYTLGSGCTTTTVVTVYPLPTAILGVTSVCSGLTTSLSDATGGGIWSSSAPLIASVGSAGLVTGGAVLSASTATITYALSSTGCIMTTVVTVNPLPTAILGTLSVCSGLTTSLSDAATGGTWSSSSSGVASVGSSGIVTGGSVGVTTTATITYTLPTTCLITATVTVNPLPTNILGNLSVCQGLTTSLSDLTSGGAWSSSNPSLASIGTSGIVTASLSLAGTAVITYTLPTGCIMTAVVTVNALPTPILGTLTVCQGLTTGLSDATSGGTWSSSASGIASVSGGITSTIVTGTATGAAALTATITYTLPTTCITTAIVTVNPLPAAITGTLTVCSGLTTQLSDATALGTWSSSASGIASVGLTTGLVTGTGSFGTALITYKLPTGCLTAVVVTVDPLPASITGVMVVCSGLSTSLSDVTPSGTWSTSDPTVATVGSTGIVTGSSVSVTSTATITYTIPTGCIMTAVVTVNPLPTPILGATEVCFGLTTNLSDATSLGTWSSSNSNATIGSLPGIVNGSNVGTSIITYKLPTGCLITSVMTVNPLPATITGTMNVCVSLTTMLTDASGGGTWSTSNTSIGTAGSVSGGITGISPGTVIVTYTLPTGCIATTIVTVNPQPAAITGIASVCFGSTTNLTDVTTGGVWSSSNTAIANVSSTGLISTVAVGTATISYTLSAGCSALDVVTVNPLPAVYSVTGGGSYCQGGSGVHIGLSGSNVGISYLLYYGASATGYLAGSGSPLDFGLLTVGGTYTVRATDNLTGCTSDMFGNAVVMITPTVTPTVGIITGVGDTVCPGTAVTFIPVAGNGGLSPTYQWSVDSVLVGLGNSYTFIPADSDVIKVVMTSDGVCVTPLTAVGYYRIRVIPDGAPQVSIAIDPGDTVCQFAAATFTATPTFGGPTPAYIWYVNNIQQAGSGSVFSYAPSTGDIVFCKMVSDYQCRLSDTAYSNVAIMTVAPMIIPHVEIIPAQGFYIVQGNTDSLWTIVTNAGPDPTYQWEINGVPIPGATSSSLVKQFNNYDSVTCIVTSSGVCQGISTFDWVYITIIPAGVQQYTVGNSDIRLLPNPNKGVFTVKGTLGTLTDEEISLEVTDMLGQVVYRNKVMTHDGKINEQVRMENVLANGMYLLNLRSGSDNKVFHFVIEQ